MPFATIPSKLLTPESLPSLPSVAIEIMRIAEDKNATLEDISEAISRDPGLTAKLLKLSSSVLFSMGSEVHTIQQASIVLGMKSVMMLALSFSLVDAMDIGDENFDFDDFWVRSLAVAVAGRSFAISSGNPALADEAFLCGMLSHIGGSILARGMPSDYQDLLAKSPGNWPSPHCEEEHFGFTQSDVMLALLGSWSLPARTVTTVSYMQRPEFIPKGQDDDTRELTAIMALASISSRVLFDNDKVTSYRKLRSWAGTRYGIGHEALDAMLREFNSGVAEMAGLHKIVLPPGESTSSLVQAAREQLLKRSLSSVHNLNAAKKSHRREKDEIERRATTDELTGLPNRAALNHKLSEEVSRRLGRNIPDELGVLMMDVDHFKTFNDNWGHAAGDAILAAIGDTLTEVLRPGDFAARYGGEEFTVIMPLATAEGMRITAQRIRQSVEQMRIPWEGEILRVTISLGGARLSTTQSELDGQRLLETADAKLYKAKENGRNCFLG